MTHARHRTMSNRKAAGSRRNKAYRFVGTQYSDTVYVDGDYSIGHGSQPNHTARMHARQTLDSKVFPLLPQVKMA